MRNPVDKPVGVTGHTATVVGNDMIVLFGYSPERGVTNLIQVFGLGKCNVHAQGLTHFEQGNLFCSIFKLRVIILNFLRTPLTTLEHLRMKCHFEEVTEPVHFSSLKLESNLIDHWAMLV